MIRPQPDDAAARQDANDQNADPMPSGGPRGPWYRDGIRFECQGTGRCCTARGDYGHVYLSADEAGAAAALLEMSLTDFEDAFCRFDDGERELRFQRGACVFLDGHQCSIYEARPVQCRTWPFWPENLKKKAWDRDVAPFCAGVGKGRLYSIAEIETIARAADGLDD